jgi:hypothetical protein
VRGWFIPTPRIATQKASVGMYSVRKGYGSRSMCVCLSVHYQANCHKLGSYVENKVPLGFPWQSQRMYCVDFVENVLFKSSGDIC